MSKKPKETKRGRPKKPKGEQFTAQLLIHCHPTDRERWSKLAAAAGMKVSAWARDRLNRARR